MLLSKFSRLGKKEQPSDWPKYAEAVEHTAEDIRRMATDISKSIQHNVLTSKRSKKCPELQLAVALKDTTDKSSGEDKLFVEMIRQCAEVNNSLGELRREFEAKVEKSVVEPLNRLADETCANISKERRSLNKVYTETRTAREALQKISAQSNPVGSVGTATSSGGTVGTESLSPDVVSRLTQAQNQLDEKERELTNCKEQLLRDLYGFAGDERLYADVLVEYFRLQESFLQDSLQLVRKAVPELMTVINQREPMHVFHRHLPEHLAETGRTISYALQTCISRLNNDNTLLEEGLFRKSGIQRKVDLLVRALNLMQADDQLLDSCDSAVLTGALKQYLQTLPEPLITYAFAEQWAEASSRTGQATLHLIETALPNMPVAFRRNLAYLCLFLHKVSTKSALNKMTTDNLSIVIGPNLYRLPASSPLRTTDSNGGAGGEPSNGLEHHFNFLQHSGPAIRLTDLLIENAERLFSDDNAYFKSARIANFGNTSGHVRTSSWAEPRPRGNGDLDRSRGDNLSIAPRSTMSRSPSTPQLDTAGTSPIQDASSGSPPHRPRRPVPGVPPPSRKKTAAPKPPPIPPSLPSPPLVSVTPASPDSPYPSFECGHLVDLHPSPLHETLVGTPVVTASITPTAPPIPTDGEDQSGGESKSAKEPPRRPPPPIGFIK
ncbi:unnamed protein product [Calicophoron daubneyi]|uniref:Rho-GAP domain-containing protein n=1 Tax=Calicophoron daubneyi TaxID=300641 RepID=A0AAV2TAV5_CALDB